MAGWEFHVKHEEGSLVVEVKGDPKRMQARQEAVDAFIEFRKKARAAGMTPGCILRDLIMGRAAAHHRNRAAEAPCGEKSE